MIKPSMPQGKKNYLLRFISDKNLRMYKLASQKFEDSLYLINDFTVLQGYARSLCGYLKMERTSINASAVSQGKEKVIVVIEDLCRRHNTDGIAEILKNIPPRVEYSALLCLAFNSIVSIDGNYFSKGRGLTRRELVYLPKLFFLDEDFNPVEYLVTAAKIYQEVVKDPALEYIYGEVQLKWITELNSPHLIISIVKSAIEDTNLNFVVAGRLFKNNIYGEVSISDHDIEVSHITIFATSNSSRFSLEICH